MTKLEIVNAAFDMIGEQKASALTENQPRVEAANRQWPFALGELLRAAQWNWAKKRVELDEASGSPLFEWNYQYELPADYLTLVALNELTTLTPGEDYEIEEGYLLTDASEAKIEYIYQPVDAGSSGSTDSDTTLFLSRMDPLAVNAFVTLLASKLATPLVRDGGSLASVLRQQYQLDLSKARVKNANEQKRARRNPADESRMNASRWSSTNG